MKLTIVLTFCLGFVACIPGPRDQVIINVESRPAPMPKSSGNFLLPTVWIGFPDLPYFLQSDPADFRLKYPIRITPEEPSASNKITPEMAEKLNELFHTGSNYLERFVNFLGSIFTEGSSAEEEEPFKPKKVFQLNIPYAHHYNPLLIWNCSWILTIHKVRNLQKKLHKTPFLAFKNGVKSIQNRR